MPKHGNKPCNPKWTQSNITTHRCWSNYQPEGSCCPTNGFTSTNMYLVQANPNTKLRSSPRVSNKNMALATMRFSPVVKMMTLRLLLRVVVVVTEDFELEQLDVKTAFLHGESGRGYLHVPTVRFHNDEGGRSPCLPTKEKPLQLEASTKDVVPNV